jgi:hypothetical protein
LQQYANYFIQRLNKIKQSILPNYLFIPEAPSITFDSFTGLQRMITVQLSFNLVVPTNCDPGVITLVQCIANIVTSSNLTASLTTVLKFAASLEGRATVTADIALVQKVASSLNAFGTLTGDITFVKNMQAALNGTAALSGGINFVQKPEASLNAFGTLVSDLKIAKTFESSLNANGTLVSNATIAKNLASSLTSSNSLAASALVSKLAASSLTGAGTLAADLTVTSAIDADAQAFFNRVTTAGGTLSATEQNAVNTLVLALKADGIWTKMKAIYPMVGASAAACAQNLMSASFTGTFSSGWTFANTGVKPNGTSAILNIGLNPSTVLTTPSHLSYYTGDNLNKGSDQVDVGISNFWLSLWYNGSGYNAMLARNQSSTVLLESSTVTNSRGFGITTKIGNTSKIFMNNILRDTKTDTTTIYENLNMVIGALVVSNILTTLFTNRDCRFSSIGDGLTDTEAANFYTAVQAFQTTLNRQV